MQKKLKILLLLSLVLVLSCKKKNNNQPTSNPNQVSVNVNVTIYKNSSEFFPLLTASSYIYHSGGAGGLIIYRVAMNETNGDFLVFERNCPHEGGTNPNAIVYVQPDFTAKDTVCHSRFYLTSGAVANGPSAYPLRQYNYTYNGTVLHIFN
jgi:Rieske Fe-S protein